MKWLARLWRTRSLGERGERIAARFLKRHGYSIIERNLSLGDDEADLVALDRSTGTLVIVEVKTRRNDDIVPEASVGAKKRLRLTRLAARVQRHPKYRHVPIRFDVIAVVWPTRGAPMIRHSIAAFDSVI